MFRLCAAVLLIVASVSAHAGFIVVDEKTGEAVRNAPAATPTPAPVTANTMNAPLSGDAWSLRSGDVIEESVKRWADKAGWQVSWKVQRMVAEADFSVSTGFEEAIDLLMEALNAGGAGITAYFIEDPRVLTRIVRITEKTR